MIAAADPDIPRWLVASAEWLACLAYIMLARPRVSVSRVAVHAAAALSVLLLVHLWGEGLPQHLWPLGMAAGIGVMLVFVRTTARGGNREAGDLTARAFVLAELAASLAWQLLQFFNDYTVSAPDHASALVALGTAVIAAGYVIERRQYPEGSALAVDGRSLATVLGIALATFVVSNLSFVASNTPFSARLGPELLYVRTLVDLCGFVVLYAQRGQRLKLQRAVEVERMDMMLRNQHDRYLQAEHDIDAVNRKYHDLKHYIHALRSETDPGRRAGYVDQLEASIRGYESSVVDTGSPVLDTLVAAKLAQAERADVSLTCMIDGATVDFVDPLDLVAMVGNTLDNALEAAACVEDVERRLVRASVFAQGSFVILRVENVVGSEPHLTDDLPVTTKGDRRLHGFGLRSVRDTSERYGGSLTVRVEDGWFSVRILLPRP